MNWLDFGVKLSKDKVMTIQIRLTRGSAIAEEPRDALRQLKYYGRFFDWAIDKKLDGLHVKTSALGEWPSRSFKVTAVATIW